MIIVFKGEDCEGYICEFGAVSGNVRDVYKVKRAILYVGKKKSEHKK